MSEYLDHIARYLSRKGDQVSIAPIGNGTNGTGHILNISENSGAHRSFFLKTLSNAGFGNELPANRLERMVNGAVPYAHSIPVHAVFAVDQQGQVLGDVLRMAEAVTVSELLPPDSINVLESLRSPDIPIEGVQFWADLLSTTMKDIHGSEKYRGENATALYQRSTRSIIHNEELTPGVWDFAKQMQPRWISSDDYVHLVNHMMQVRERMPLKPQRLCRIQGDYWAANIFLSSQGVHVTDSRTVWGEPAIDASWMVGEFCMQNYVRTGQFAGEYTSIAWQAIQNYQRETRDTELTRFMALPYAFQTFAEAVFTPGLSDSQRRTIFLAGYGGLLAAQKGRSFSAPHIDEYVQLARKERGK